MLKERDEIRAALKKQLQDMPPVPDTAERFANYQQTLETSVRNAQRSNGALMRQLSEFLDTYYPTDEAYPASQSQGLSQSHASSQQEPEGRTLKEQLQDLMNRSVTKPEDPWLQLTPQNSNPKHVELLLRAGIATKDPKDGRRLKLVDFYR